METARIEPKNGIKTVPAQEQKERAAQWFQQLRDMICASFEKIEEEYFSGAIRSVPGSAVNNRSGEECVSPAFTRKAWERDTADKLPGGGGVMSVMHGRVFEKVGVNISTVYGHFSPEFRGSIPGATENGGAFWASGISLVAHMANPRVPSVHMNTRYVVTQNGWFGGGADLTPAILFENDTRDFHARLQTACDAHDARYYPMYKKWCDEYFFIKHRNEARGVGGIFYDYHDSGDWDADFAFTRDVGLAFLDIFPALVRRHMFENYTPEEKHVQLLKRGRYAEFNLVYDRGTKFGLMTGGNTEAILMSLPPEAKWP